MVRSLVSRAVILSIGIGMSCIPSLSPFDASSSMTNAVLMEKAVSSSAERLILRWLGPFAHWDGAYFLQIARFGYEHEKIHAFFPGLPLVLRAMVRALCGSVGCGGLHFRSLAICSGILWNGVVCSYLAAVLLYHLSGRVVGDEWIVDVPSYDGSRVCLVSGNWNIRRIPGDDAEALLIDVVFTAYGGIWMISAI